MREAGNTDIIEGQALDDGFKINQLCSEVFKYLFKFAEAEYDRLTP